MMKIGFLGAGRMAQAMSQGFLKAGIVNKPNDISLSDINRELLDQLKMQNFSVFQNNRHVTERSNIVFLSVKPCVVTNVLKEISSSFTPDKLLVSIAAGIPLSTLERSLPAGSKVIRVMPNMPCLVLQSACAFSLGCHAGPSDGERVHKLLQTIGLSEEVPECYMDAVTGLAGSGPAFVYVAIEALADGGVKMGLPRALALTLASQTVLGAAKMCLETNQHPAVLKDSVCSPGGTTIEGIHALEKQNFRTALIDAVEAATLKSRRLKS